MPGRYEIRSSVDGQFFFNLKAANGEKILTSETYQTRSGAKNGIESVRENAPVDERYVRRNPAPGRYSFLLRARNGETIGRSEEYTTAAAREKGIESVKANAPDATVSDLT